MNKYERRALLDELVPDQICPVCDKRRPVKQGSYDTREWVPLTPYQMQILESKTGKSHRIVCKECYRKIMSKN